MKNLATTIKQFNEENENQEKLNNLDISDSIIDDLIEAVGSEEDVEAAAEEAYKDLKSAHESGSIEMLEEGVPENLAMSALVLKLVEQGKLDIKKADAFIGDNADD